MAYNKATATRQRTRVMLDDNLFPREVWIPQGKFRGHRPLEADKGRFKALCATVVTDNAWHRARVTHGRQVLFTGPPTRDKEAARKRAQEVMANAKRMMGDA
jgi:hypothetical protein